MFKTEQVLSDGSTVYYLHDRPELSDSVNIWKLTGSAFAVSSDGGETWNAGVDAEGNVVMNILSAIGIDASWIKAANLDAISAKIGGWEIVNGSLFKEYQRNGRIYRVSINPPNIIEESTTESIISVHESVDNGNTFRWIFDLNSIAINIAHYDAGSLWFASSFGANGLMFSDFKKGKRLEMTASGYNQYSF